MSGPDPIATLLGDVPEYDRQSFDRLVAWAVAKGCPPDDVAFYLLGFVTAFMVKGGATPMTLGRVVTRIGELALAEIERRK